MRAKRVLLMYISEISGHHSATLAVEKAIKVLSPHTEVLNINAFNYTNPISEKIVNRLYMEVIKRTPKIWEYLYDNPAVVSRLEKIKEGIHKFNSPKLKKLFDRFQPDVITCSQAFPCGMAADFKRTYQSNIPLVAILTDYIPHSYWIYDTVDYYISPSEEVSIRLMEKGVPARKVKTFGIPFDLKFNAEADKLKICERLGLEPDLFTILIMGGGQGLGPIKTIVRYLGKTKGEFQNIIVSGTNKKLYKSLKKNLKDFNKTSRLFSYVENVHELMAVSDVIITKPGGITTAEALGKNLPMIIINPIPGQEASNTAYLTSKGAAIKVDDPQEAGWVINDLMNNPEKLCALKKAAANISKPQASMDIARLLLKLGDV